MAVALAAPDRPTRARKSVERFSEIQRDETDHETVSRTSQSGVENAGRGTGEPIGDMEDVCFRINKLLSSDLTLKHIHSLMYGRPGKATVLKKNIRIWNGCASGTEEVNRIRMHTKLDKFPISTIKPLARVFGLELKGTKEELVDRLITFLLCPSNSQRTHSSIPIPKKKTKAIAKKTKATNDTSTSAAPRKRKIKEDQEAEAKPKKVTKREVSPQSSDDEDEPLGKMLPMPSSKATTDSTIISKVQKIIQEADLDILTAKGVCKQLAKSFPDLDIKTRKSWLHQQIGLAVKARSSGTE
ncbi:hypothetical protein BJ684DRAFT_19826 [Piptocephalis cylindrospora]|uniref:Uncharacterized protein n=1 Tax=Piptocephalis cylindrospora TaxID=1907219 RepID=A0A4P9Y4V3_9FUNG|nr:hypothetical protein BJ684DRAFT_19826 [Piptocephalis cylindrospora]|eukprot:RKP13712.1 hypothetical protein BJ684DRAFT_19826 [Piptocephalis cylindrospora]